MNLFILFFFITRIVAENPQFITCRKSIDCGKIRNISYPFFDGITRPDYCGYPGFELKCFNGNPLITISNQEFNLLGINNNTIRISMTNFSSTNACPIQLLNTSIDFSNFSFTALDQNITFYGCKQAVPTSPLIALNCDFLGSWSTGYYLTRSMLEKNNGELDLWGNCKSVVIPILQSAAKLIDQSLTLPALVKSLLKAFEAGFELGLIATTGLCSSCIGSGGACGFDSGARKFVCYCAAGNSSFICDPDGPDPVPNQAQAPNIPEIVDATGKKHNVTPLAIGASIGALFVAALVIGCCYLVLQQRRKHQILQDEASQNPIPSSGNVGLIPTRASEPLSSQAYTSSSSATYSHSLSSYASSTHEDERASAYFGVHVFDYSDLQQATSGFNKELGSGGYGSVYYGQLPDGRLVAVKRLYENSFRRIEQFMNEIEILARMRHKNLVTLYGCTSKKSRVLVLVYEYVPNGTVADHLHGKQAETAFLKWPIRLSIAVETAEALAYLHRSGVIHRDVKTTNILLDNDFHVKVADFGLSRLFHDDATHVSTFPQGTPGYVDPDYYNCFRLTEKSDVYSFGVILIELISSMQAVDGAREDHVNLASMALDRIQNRALHELVDPQLGFQSDHEIQRMVKMVAELGFRCLQPEKDMRPTMEEAATTLRGIQMVKANSIRQEGMVVVACGDDVGLLKGIRA